MVNITNNYYNLDNFTSSHDLLIFMNSVNGLSDGYFMIGILIVGWIILFLSMQGRGNKDAFVVSTFITSVLSILFLILNFITLKVALFIIIPAAVVVAITIVRPD